MQSIVAKRITFTRLTRSDAAFIVALQTDADWLRYIGDRGVRTEQDAVAYIDNGPGASYAAHGFGLYRVSLRSTGEPIGICGLLQRDTLPDPDIGYALLPAHRGKGYAAEAAAATLTFARETLGITRILAIVSPENAASIRVLEKIGMVFERSVQMRPDAAASALYTSDAAAG